MPSIHRGDHNDIVTTMTMVYFRASPYIVAQNNKYNRRAGPLHSKITALLILLLASAFVFPATAQQFQGLARIDVGNSGVTGRPSKDVDIRLELTLGVPFRVFTLDQPTRLVLDFQQVDFAGIAAGDLLNTDLVTGIRFGIYRPGWSRMVLDLVRPMSVHRAELRIEENTGRATLDVRLTPQDPVAFAAASGAVADDIWALPLDNTTAVAKKRQTGDRKIVVALDPGHGGIDPGAQYGGHNEADLMLLLARELKEKLLLSGRYQVNLTREEDYFLSLESRVSKARSDGADVFISLHADALSRGKASGTTVYTLSDKASDAAAGYLAAAHDRSDLLAGVDLSLQDDVVATVLMDMARLETAPRGVRLAEELVVGIAKSVGRIRSRPHLQAGFSVLKAPDIPSVLVEFGFMSNPLDLSNLASADWREKVTSGILQALDIWTISDAAEAQLLRQ